MKMKIFGGMFAVAITATAAVNANFNTLNNGVATITLSNVEALANGENYNCPNGCLKDGDGCFCHVWYPTYREAGNL